MTTTLASAITMTAIETVKGLITTYSYGSNLSVDVLDCEIHMAIISKGLKFENMNAYDRFFGFVQVEIKNISPSIYNMIYPEMKMDENGDYTTNKDLWV